MMRIRLPGLAVVLAALCTVAFSQEDLDAYRQAARLQDSGERLEALRSFTERFPESTYLPFAHLMMFNAHLDQGNEEAALREADRYANAIAEIGRPMAYNNIAWTLAQKGRGLDTALVYANRAESALRKRNDRQLNMILDTKAFVLFTLKRYEEAETLQREALKGHEKDPEYLFHLALFQAGRGKYDEACRTAAYAMILGDYGEPLTKFKEWVGQDEGSKAAMAKKRDAIVMDFVQTYLDTIPKQHLVSERGRAAKLLASTSVNLKTAFRWADEASRSLTKSSSLRDIILQKSNLAAVLSAQGKTKEAIKVIDEIKGIVDVWDADFWLMAGGLYEQAGQSDRAKDAYLTGLVARRDDRLVDAVKGLSKDDVDTLIEKKREAMLAFDPGHYKAPVKASGRIVLAELFTGAECNPCQAADEAFDKLAEYYPRSALAILEYHVHIPGPDPMTTNETHDRYMSYGNTGTPTVYFNGSDQIIGGGPKYVASNRFNVYKHTIDKSAGIKPAVHFSGKAGMKGEDVNVMITVSSDKTLGSSLALHTALVERSVDYTGSNGVSKHLFVVRDLLDGAGGMPVTLKRGKQSFDKSVNVGEIERGNKVYLDNPKEQESWPQRLQNFPGWKARPEKLNRENLAIVAWIQNTDTKEIMQAFYIDVSSSLSAR